MFIKFESLKTPVEGTVSVSGNVATLKFKNKPTVNTSGFRLYLDKEMKFDLGGADYLGFKTIYRNDEETAKYNGYQLSNDESVYTPPVPSVKFLTSYGGDIEGEKEQNANNYEDLAIPTPVPNENYAFAGWNPEIPESGPIDEDKRFTATFTYVPTLEEVQEMKVNEMNKAQQEIIQQGLDVQLSDGSTEHFTLTDHDQTSLMGLQTQVAVGIEQIPWHTSDEAEHCKFYSNADMALITAAAMAYVTWHVTYFRDLRIYIRAIQSKEEIGAVTYGMDIPEQYQSDVLKALIAQKA